MQRGAGKHRFRKKIMTRNNVATYPACPPKKALRMQVARFRTILGVLDGEVLREVGDENMILFERGEILDFCIICFLPSNKLSPMV
jgi:hypothetical protein